MRNRISSWLRWAAIAVLVVAVGISLYFVPRTREHIAALLARIDELGAWGPVLVGASTFPRPC